MRINFVVCLHGSGATPNDGVPDMTVISEIDEYGINTNLKVRYKQGRIYVSLNLSICLLFECVIHGTFLC